MTLQSIQQIFFRDGKLTRNGWITVVSFILLYMVLKHMANQRREEIRRSKEAVSTIFPPKTSDRAEVKPTLASTPLPKTIPLASPKPLNTASPRANTQPSFGNSNSSNKILSDDFLPKGTMIYATLTSDIVSNNQLSPATATVIIPTIFSHKLQIPVGTQVTGKIAPGNLRGRVFVTWDTLVFYEEGRQGWELPIKGIGMTYEQNSISSRWVINGAGLKGYIFDDSSANAFKLAALKAMQDFTKTLQTYVQTQSTFVSGLSVTTTTNQRPDSTMQNGGLAASEAFIDTIAQRYAAQLQQQNSYVLVPTSRMCAIFLDEPIDITLAGPGKSLKN